MKKKLIVTVEVYLEWNETPSAVRARIERAIEVAIGPRVSSSPVQVDTIADTEEMVNPGDYTPV